jgi:hypothetical protein
MAECTQFEDTFGESQSEESAPRFSRTRGRHHMARGSRSPAASFRRLRTAAVVASTAALAAAAFAVGTHHGPGSSSASAQAAISVPQMTAADVQQLQNMTPAQAELLNADLTAAYGRLGVHVGIGPSGTPTLPEGTTQSAAAAQPTLTSYQWAAGIQWNHAWVTASYANLQPIANNSGVIVSTAAAFCTKLKGGYAIACAAVGNLIAYFLGKVHVTNWSSSHGVWGAYYWLPFTYKTGGFW